MLTVLLVWEQGAGLGHVTRLKVIADQLLSAGHKVHLALKDIEAYIRLYPEGVPSPLALHQSPLWLEKKVRLSREPVSLTELMLAFGYHKAPTLAAHLGLWQALINSIKPNVIVYDYAPTAILASRGLSCTKVSLHTPFSSPPAVSPIPSFQREEKMSSDNLVLSDKKFVQVVNQALTQRSLPSIQYAYEAFETDPHFLMSIPELDMFAQYRKKGCYLGAVETLEEGVQSNSIKDIGKYKNRIFAYLKTDYANLDVFLKVIRNDQYDATVFIPNCPQSIIQQYGETLEISSKPLCMKQILRGCDLVVCHGGHTTVLHSVLSGLPVLIIPLQQEQLMTAHCTVDHKMGLGLAPTVDDEQEISHKIAELLSNQNYKSKASLLAQQYKDFTAKKALTRVVYAIEQSL